MILYHGSYIVIPKPDITHSRLKVDFGPGFYTTPILEQAIRWCGKFKRHGKQSIVSQYNFDESAYEKIKLLKFDTYSEEWLDFILSCRRGKDTSEYDLIIGGVANDKVFNTVELYFDHLIDKTEAIKRLRYEKPNLQFCFRNQKIIDEYLQYERSTKL